MVFAAEALSGLSFEHGGEVDPDAWLGELGIPFDVVGGEVCKVDARAPCRRSDPLPPDSRGRLGHARPSSRCRWVRAGG